MVFCITAIPAIIGVGLCTVGGLKLYQNTSQNPRETERGQGLIGIGLSFIGISIAVELLVVVTELRSIRFQHITH